MARRQVLTPAVVDQLTWGEIRDPQTPGLFIEVLSSGKKVWKYARRVAGGGPVVRLSLGRFPACAIADAREQAGKLNEHAEAGNDPRPIMRAEQTHALMTVARAHVLYMQAVREGRSSKAKRRNKPRTIDDKLRIFKQDIGPRLGSRIIYEVSEGELVTLVTGKGKTAKIRANRLAAELKVFFGWCASLRGLEVGLEIDPSIRLHDLRFPETPRSRSLTLQEIEWFLVALAEEKRDYRRGFLLWLLSATRLSEVIEARSSEVADGVWTIPAARTKNASEHRVALGPWGTALLTSESEWLFPAPKVQGPRSRNTWHVAARRIREKMERLAGRKIEQFTPHDLRRTLRSNTKRLKIDFETAEAMLNHLKKGLERTYDCYELEEEKRTSFLIWEREIAAIARRAGVAQQLLLPDPDEESRTSGNRGEHVAERRPLTPKSGPVPPWQVGHRSKGSLRDIVYPGPTGRPSISRAGSDRAADAADPTAAERR